MPTPGEGYQGPTIPTSVVDSALSEKPALELIERGETGKGTYQNGEIGLSYTISHNVGELAKEQPTRRRRMRSSNARGTCWMRVRWCCCDCACQVGDDS